MADEETGTPTPNDGKTQQASDVTKLAQQLAEAKLATAQATTNLEEARAAKATVEQELSTVKTAHADLHTQLTATNANLTAKSTTLQQLESEKVNLQAQVDSMATQLSEVAGEVSTLQAGAQVFNTIADNPELHAHIGQYAALKGVIDPNASPEAISAALKNMGQASTESAQKLANDYVGGQPPPAPKVPNVPQGQPLAKSKQEAFARWTAAKSTKDQAAITHWRDEMYRLTDDTAQPTAGA